MSKQLHRRFRVQTLLNALKREGRNARRKLSLGHTGLHTQDLCQHVAMPKLGRGHIIQAHVPKTVKSPGFHMKQ
jgi:hypothetical protein